MDGAKFTWFPKLTSTVAKVPDEHKGAFLWALAQYGTYGVEPDLAWPLDAIFEGLREDIDCSKRSIETGRKGGRGRKNGGSEDVETPLCETDEPPFTETETPLSRNAKPPFVGAGKGGSEEAEPNTRQDKTIQDKTDRKSVARFRKPTVEEVAAYADERGIAIDAQRFCDFYASKGWRVGSSPMRDWRAAVRNWAARDKGRKVTESANDEYSRL